MQGSPGVVVQPHSVEFFLADTDRTVVKLTVGRG